MKSKLRGDNQSIGGDGKVSNAEGVKVVVEAGDEAHESCRLHEEELGSGSAKAAAAVVVRNGDGDEHDRPASGLEPARKPHSFADIMK